MADRESITKIYPLITLEEHFFATGTASVVPAYQEQLKWIPGLLDKLQDVGAGRIENMDKNGISMQVVSHGPGLACAPPEKSVEANN